MRIVNQRICYADFNVVLPEGQDPFTVAQLFDHSARSGVIRQTLNSANIPYTIERPEVTLRPAYRSEYQSRNPYYYLPDCVECRVLLHDGNRMKLIFACKALPTELDLIWKTIYQRRIYIPMAQRRAAEAKYHAEVNSLTTEWYALQHASFDPVI